MIFIENGLVTVIIYGIKKLILFCNTGLKFGELTEFSIGHYQNGQNQILPMLYDCPTCWIGY